MYTLSLSVPSQYDGQVPWLDSSSLTHLRKLLPEETAQGIQEFFVFLILTLEEYCILRKFFERYTIAGVISYGDWVDRDKCLGNLGSLGSLALATIGLLVGTFRGHICE